MNVQDVLLRIVGPVNFVLTCQSLVVLGRKEEVYQKSMLWHNNRHIHRYFIIVIILSLHTVIRSFYKEHTSAN